MTEKPINYNAEKFSEYQEQARKTAIYPGLTVLDRLLYVTLGLVGESGEVANKVKKILRDDQGVLTPERKLKIIDELGDIIWYLSQTCSELNISFEEVAQRNLIKLSERQRNNQIHGDKRKSDT